MRHIKFVGMLLLIINLNLFGYNFSEILPQNTMLYVSLEDFKSLSANFKNLPDDSFYKSKEFNKIKSELKKVISIYLYSEDKNMLKVDDFLNNLKKLSFNSFAFTIGLDKFFNPHPSLIIDGKNLKPTFEKLYKELFNENIKKGRIVFKKQMLKGVKIDILELNNTKSKNKKKSQIIYASINDKLIITASVDYMGVLLSTIKNKNIPKLSNNLIFKKDKVKYPKSEIYMFADLKILIRLLSLTKDGKELSNKFSLKKLESFILYSKIDKKTGVYKTFARLTSLNGLPKFIKIVLAQNEAINIPKFIPENCYSFSAFHVNFAGISDVISKASTKKDKKRMRDLELSIGITVKDFLGSIGGDFYYLNFFKNDKDNFAFMFSFSKPSFLINLLRSFGATPAVGVTEKAYLDGSLFTSTGNFNLLGYAVGYKNNYFMLGDINIVKEMMQKMGGKSGSFYDTAFYKKVLSINNLKQNIISLTDNSISFFTTIRKLKKDFIKTYGTASTKKGMKTVKAFKRIVDSLSGISLSKLKKYFNYYLFRLYVDKNEVVLEFGEFK